MPHPYLLKKQPSGAKVSLYNRKTGKIEAPEAPPPAAAAPAAGNGQSGAGNALNLLSAASALASLEGPPPLPGQEVQVAAPAGPPAQQAAGIDTSDRTPRGKPKTERPSNKRFPDLLREILDLPEAKEMIEWLPGGEAFVVLKSFDLASEILPRYFKSGQYESFVRKLNRWGFRRDSRGRRTGAFYHEHFIRDRPDLMIHMSNRRAVANPRGLGPKHLRGVFPPGPGGHLPGGLPPPPGAATAAAAAAAADRQHANATMGLGMGVGLDALSGMSDSDFIALRHRQLARQHAAAAAAAAVSAGGGAGAAYPGDPMLDRQAASAAPGFLEAYAAHEASRMGLRHGSAAAPGAAAPGASPPGASAVAGAPGLPPPLPPHAAGMGAFGASSHLGDPFFHRHFLGAGGDPLIREASLVGQANGNPQLAAAAADLAEAEAELVRLRSIRALRAGGALPPHHTHAAMAHLPPGAAPGPANMPPLPAPGASVLPLPAAGAPMPPQGEATAAAAPVAAVPPPTAATPAAAAAAGSASAPAPVVAGSAPPEGDPVQMAAAAAPVAAADPAAAAAASGNEKESI